MSYAFHWLKKEFALTNQKHYPDLGSQVINIKISAPLSLTSFPGKTNDGLAKCQLFSQAKRITILLVLSTNDH